MAVACGAAAFGALDLCLQRMGSDTAFWLSNMSAFWLLLPFLAGQLMPSLRLSAGMGLLVTLVALIAFYAAAQAALPPEVRAYVSAGVVTGPTFGALGYRWRNDRWWLSGLTVVLAFCCEPFAWRQYKGFLPGPGYVWRLEVLLGLALAVWFAQRVITARRTGRHRI